MAIPTRVEQDVFIIECPAKFDTEFSRTLSEEMTPWAERPEALHLFDFKNTTALMKSTYRPFAQYAQLLKSKGRHLGSIGLTESLAQQIRFDGLDSTIPIFKSIEEAKKKFGLLKKKNQINGELLTPFTTALRATLKTQARLEMAPEKPFIKGSDFDANSLGIAGVLTLVSEEFAGTVAICCSTSFFLSLYERVVGEKHPSITPAVEEGAKELMSVIFAQSKALLSTHKGYRPQRASSAILIGERLHQYATKSSNAVCLPFKTEIGNLHIEVLTS